MLSNSEEILSTSFQLTSILFKSTCATTSEEIFEYLVKHLPFGVIIANEKNDITFKNIIAERLLKTNEIDYKSLLSSIISIDNNRRSSGREGSSKCNRKIITHINGKNSETYFAKILRIKKINQGSDEGDFSIIVFTSGKVDLKTEKILSELFLTPSQSRIACLISNGLSLKDAASFLGIKESTARQNMKEVISRLGVKSQKDVVAFVKNLAAVD